MKKLFTFLFCAALCLGMGVSALADVAYEPQDSFYSKHRSECGYENRSYITNGSEGWALFYSAPGSGAQAAVPNGRLFYVSYTYESSDGLWGCVEYDPDAMENLYGGTAGWVSMDSMTPDYDYISFDADHSDEYAVAESTLTLGEREAVCYKYPGSGIVTDTIGNYTDADSVDVLFSRIFTDSEGREWGFLSYFYGHRNTWVCLSDPYNSALPADENFVQPDIVAADESSAAVALEKAQAPTAYILTGAVAVIIIAAAVLLFIIRKRKRS